eukprot:TRINITY_DN7195_c0_g1_i1.p1 TRINITY_DN7195_c0_g1~~TRINITY_DN7195_c0_g1_i1.p1  ORF type:complete len:195 (+),score=36.31 TRINITY_DN7195_c0_g1_i1:93-677(+)
MKLCCFVIFAVITRAHAGGSWFLARKMPAQGLETSSAAAVMLKERPPPRSKPVASIATNITLEEKVMSKSEVEETHQKVAQPSTSDNATSSRKRRRAVSREASLIESLRHMGGDEGDLVGCVSGCRYGEEVRHTWRDCLERCVTNPLVRSTLMAMLPEEHHAAPSIDADVPHGLEVPDAAQYKSILKKMRSSEL